MKIKVTVYSRYGYDERKCVLTVNFRDNLELLAKFITMSQSVNCYMCYELFTPRQRARIVGSISRITVDKFIN